MGAEEPAEARDPDRDSDRPGRGGFWPLGLWTLKIAVLAAIAVLAFRLLRDLDWREMWSRLRDARHGWATAVVLATLARYLAWVERWRCGLRAAGIEVPRRLAAGALFASAAINTVTPSARVFGGLLRARYLAPTARRRSFGDCYGTVLYDQLQHQLVNGLLGVLAVILVAGRRGSPWLALGGVAVMSAVVLGVWRWWRGSHHDRTPWLEGLAARLAERAVERRAGSWRATMMEHGSDALEMVSRLLQRGPLALQALLLGVAFFVANAGAQWLAFRAIGAEVGPLSVAVVVALGSFAGIAAGTPGGMGAAEAAMIAAFVGLGVDRVDATAGTLLYRGAHYLVTFGVGVPFLVGLELDYRRRR